MTRDEVSETPLGEAVAAEPGHDPWEALQADTGSTDSWLLSYVDVLTLLLLLMVVLLMLQHQGKAGLSVAMIEPVVSEAPAREDDAASVHPSQSTDQAVDSGALEEVDTGVELPELTETLDMPWPPAQEQAALVTPVALLDKEGDDGAAGVSGQRPSAGSAAMERPEQPSLAFNVKPLVDVLRWKGLGDGVTLSTSENLLRLETRDSILFADASAELTESGAQLLAELAAVLASYSGDISVEGHADSRPIISGTYPSNWELSSARAAGVVRFLVEQGLPVARLRAIGYSDTRPRADNASAEGRAANRRVSLVLELSPGAYSAPLIQSPLM
jgi:chemotaxis protein MotB